MSYIDLEVLGGAWRLLGSESSKDEFLSPTTVCVERLLADRLTSLASLSDAKVKYTDSVEAKKTQKQTKQHKQHKQHKQEITKTKTQQGSKEQGEGRKDQGRSRRKVWGHSK